MKIDWKKGDYAVGKIGLCRFIEDPAIGVHIEFVSNYERGAGICSGGRRMGGGLDEFKPVTSVEHLLLARAFEALRLKKEAEEQVNIQGAHFKVYGAAIQAYKDAERASAEMMEQLTEAAIEDDLP